MISGFLITGMLLREVHSAGTVLVRRFHAARVRRSLLTSALNESGIAIEPAAVTVGGGQYADAYLQALAPVLGMVADRALAVD